MGCFKSLLIDFHIKEEININYIQMEAENNTSELYTVQSEMVRSHINQ